MRELERRILAIEEVRSCRYADVWSWDVASHVLSALVVIESNTSQEDAFRMKCDVRALLQGDHRYTNVEIEYSHKECPATVPHYPRSPRRYTFSNTMR